MIRAPVVTSSQRSTSPINLDYRLSPLPDWPTPQKEPVLNLDELKLSLKQLLVEGLKLDHVSAADIKDSEPIFVEGLGLDSIDALELVVLVEEKYGVVIPDEEVGKQAFASINALANYVAGQQSQSATARGA